MKGRIEMKTKRIIAIICAAVMLMTVHHLRGSHADDCACGLQQFRNSSR